jgi:hypothetical protein
MRKTSGILVLMALLGLGAARADTLIIDEMAEAQASAAERPTRGMSMGKVETKWGQPVRKLPAIGQPPITRWEYDGFVVYFEYEHVIDAVVARR